MNRTVYLLTVLIMLLAAAAAAAGLLWQGSGEPFEFTTLRGETVMMQGRGLYRYDSVSGAAQELGQDAVTLLVGIPLLLAGLLSSRRGSLRGHLLLTGGLGYFLYTYASMAFLTAFNTLFIVYVALFSLSLFGFILALSSLDPQDVADRMSERFPRRVVIWFLILVAGFLSLAWLGLVVPPSLQGSAPAGLDAYTTMVIQVLDLGVIVPTALITAVLLWRQRPWGFLLAAVLLVKIITMGAALISMIIVQLLAGVAVDPVVTVIFAIICVVGIALGILTLRGIRS